jgi:hypothetical protein
MIAHLAHLALRAFGAVTVIVAFVLNERRKSDGGGGKADSTTARPPGPAAPVAPDDTAEAFERLLGERS